MRVFDLASGKEIHRYDEGRQSKGFSFTPGRQVRRGGELSPRAVCLSAAQMRMGRTLPQRRRNCLAGHGADHAPLADDAGDQPAGVTSKAGL